VNTIPQRLGILILERRRWSRSDSWPLDRRVGDFWHFSRTRRWSDQLPRWASTRRILGASWLLPDEIAKLYANGVISSSHHYDTLSG